MPRGFRIDSFRLWRFWRSWLRAALECHSQNRDFWRGKLMEMHQIRYFLAVTRTLNFTRAADE